MEEAKKPRNQDTLKPRNQETKKPRNQETKQMRIYNFECSILKEGWAERGQKGEFMDVKIGGEHFSKLETHEV